MKVKIGNKVFTTDEYPIMIVLTDKDKENIAQMEPDHFRYCEYPAGKMTKAQAIRWMDDI